MENLGLPGPLALLIALIKTTWEDAYPPFLTLSMLFRVVGTCSQIAYMSRNTSIGCECGLNNLSQNLNSANQVFRPRTQPINPTVSHHLTSMEHFECVNTELGLASVGSLKTYSKGSKQIKEVEFMASPRKKKLRLTKEQLAFLEDVYLAHSIVTAVNLCVYMIFISAIKLYICCVLCCRIRSWNLRRS